MCEKNLSSGFVDILYMVTSFIHKFGPAHLHQSFIVFSKSKQTVSNSTSLVFFVKVLHEVQMPSAILAL